MSSQPDVAEISGALSNMRAVLQADGYDLDISADDGAVVLAVTAGPDACVECLVPQELFLPMVRDALVKQGLQGAADAVQLQYPSITGS
jgi:hypothetical protein